MNTFETNPFQHELNPSEKILWQGQPQQGLILREAEMIQIPLSVVWASIIAIMSFSTVIANGSLSFSLFYLPLFLIALYLTIGRFIYDIEIRRNTFYALTNERAIIISGIDNRTTQSIVLKILPEVHITTYNNGRGTIVFGSQHPLSWLTETAGIPIRSHFPVSPKFERIENAGKVYAFIKHIQQME